MLTEPPNGTSERLSRIKLLSLARGSKNFNICQQDFAFRNVSNFFASPETSRGTTTFAFSAACFELLGVSAKVLADRIGLPEGWDTLGANAEHHPLFSRSLGSPSNRSSRRQSPFGHRRRYRSCAKLPKRPRHRPVGAPERRFAETCRRRPRPYRVR